MYSLAAAREIRREYGLEVKVINVLEPSSLGEEFVRLLDPRSPLLVVYNGNPAVLSGAVGRALAMHSPGFLGRMYEHGFLRGTTGTMSEVFGFFELDEAGILRKMLHCIQE
jgi:hypothetical protein